MHIIHVSWRESLCTSFSSRILSSSTWASIPIDSLLRSYATILVIPRWYFFSHIIIHEKHKTFSIGKIELFLGEHTLEARMLCEKIYVNTIQVMSPSVQFENDCFKLEIIRWLVLLMHLNVSRGIVYNLTLLYQHTLYGECWCITIDNITFLIL